MIEGGFIALHRSLLKWEWYTDENTKALFIHLLLTVNYEPKQWHGRTIQRGQRVASYSKLASETGLTIKKIRTALKHLQATGEVAHEPNSKYGLFTVNNYDKYQSMGTIEDIQSGTQMDTRGAVKGQSKGNNGTNITSNNKDNNKTRENERGVSGEIAPARSRFVPPDESEAIAYFRERGSNAQEAAAFLNYYTANGWMVGKNRMKDRRAAARGWMQRAGQYSGKAAAPQSGEEFTDQLTRVADQLASGNISILGGIYDNK